LSLTFSQFYQRLDCFKSQFVSGPSMLPRASWNAATHPAPAEARLRVH